MIITHMSWDVTPITMAINPLVEWNCTPKRILPSISPPESAAASCADLPPAHARIPRSQGARAGSHSSAAQDFGNCETHGFSADYRMDRSFMRLPKMGVGQTWESNTEWPVKYLKERGEVVMIYFFRADKKSICLSVKSACAALLVWLSYKLKQFTSLKKVQFAGLPTNRHVLASCNSPSFSACFEVFPISCIPDTETPVGPSWLTPTPVRDPDLQPMGPQKTIIWPPWPQNITHRILISPRKKRN